MADAKAALQDAIAARRIKGKLLPHQIESVEWMLGRELHQQCGGILADDMGLGKTYQIAALLAANRSRKDQSTLIVTLVSTVAQWQKVLMDFVDMSPIILAANSSIPLPKSFDVALTTYSTFQQRKVPTEVMNRSWHRIVLDEGHAIKNAASKTNACISSLIRDKQYRWVVSGTPVHNHPRELQTLLTWVGCDVGEQDCIMRRSVEDVSDVRLPELTTCVRYLMFRYPEERALYMKLASVPAHKLKYADGRKARHLDADLRMRQACIHPRLCFDGICAAMIKDVDEVPTHGPLCEVDPVYDEYRCEGMNLQELEAIQRQQLHAGDEEPDCEIDAVDAVVADAWACEEASDDDVSDCGEYDPCKYSAMVAHDWPSTDMRVRMARDDAWFESVNTEDFRRSTKLEYLARHLCKDQSAGIKSLVFCEFKTEMNLLARYLQDVGVSYARYDGDMSQAKRGGALHNFETVPTISTLLIQVKAGGVGLNLQVASKVYITAPNWNPVTELQAIARVHRLKQTRPVTCVRLVMAGTIEETACMRAEEAKLEVIKECLGDGSTRMWDKLGFGELSSVYHIAKRNDILCKLHARDISAVVMEDDVL